MDMVKQLLENNRRYAKSFRLGGLPIAPAKKLAVVACMDARLDVQDMLGLRAGDAHIIRNAGGLVTDDALRSLILSAHLLGTRMVFVIEHTDCGMVRFTDEELRQRLQQSTGFDAGSLQFFTFRNLEENVVEQLRRLRESPFLPREMEARGFIYDVRTGRLSEVKQ